MMQFSARDLDAFVAESDRLGGPGTPECDVYWRDFTYSPAYKVNQGLDPFSEAYVDEQLALYTELSGRRFNQTENEQGAFDIAPHADAVNPYNHPDPSTLALHIQRLSKAIRLAGAKRGEHLLDMGCGWGLSSEIAAYTGMRVTAVDINPLFVELVNTRAARSGWDIAAVLGTFDDYAPQETVDMILFYECLHHALRPWTVIERLSRSLSPDGRIVLAGEPINSIWWTHWGMRLDALSIYCIRKHGWLESGWSLDFIRAAFHRCGLKLQSVEDSDPQVGFLLTARVSRMETMSGDAFLADNEAEGFARDGIYGVMSARGWLDIAFPKGAKRAQITLINYRATSVRLKAWTTEETLLETAVPHGPTRIMVWNGGDIVRVELEAETWVPDEEIANGDDRHLSLHLSEISFA